VPRNPALKNPTGDLFFLTTLISKILMPSVVPYVPQRNPKYRNSSKTRVIANTPEAVFETTEKCSLDKDKSISVIKITIKEIIDEITEMANPSIIKAWHDKIFDTVVIQG